jgi:hypothetical protein
MRHPSPWSNHQQFRPENMSIQVADDSQHHPLCSARIKISQDE